MLYQMHDLEMQPSSIGSPRSQGRGGFNRLWVIPTSDFEFDGVVGDLAVTFVDVLSIKEMAWCPVLTGNMRSRSAHEHHHPASFFAIRFSFSLHLIDWTRM
jgi:hypothetical protein